MSQRGRRVKAASIKVTIPPHAIVFNALRLLRKPDVDLVELVDIVKRMDVFPGDTPDDYVAKLVLRGLLKLELAGVVRVIRVKRIREGREGEESYRIKVLRPPWEGSQAS